MDTVSESKTYYDIQSDEPIVRSSDVDRLRIDDDLSLQEMYEEYTRKKSQ